VGLSVSTMDLVPPVQRTLWGVDFSSNPSRRKPVVLAVGALLGAGARSVLHLQGLKDLTSMSAFEAELALPGPWLGAFDFPFGLPRAFVQALGLGSDTVSVITEVQRRCATRMDFRRLVDAWGNTQPAGQRLLHRATDVALSGVTSTSPLQTRYVPVGFMYYEGLSRLVQQGVHLPHQFVGDAQRVALEGYPGLLAHELIGRRSYKNSEDSERMLARKDIVERLEQGRTRLGLRLKLSSAQAGLLVADASGDRLDAVLCLVQAAWAQGQANFGWPAQVDPVEGWITTA
jgi:Protein of unknown function (DUF429)